MSATLTAPVHIAAGKNGSKLVHVIAERSAVCATNGTRPYTDDEGIDE